MHSQMSFKSTFCLVFIYLLSFLEDIQSVTEVLRPRGVSLDSNYHLFDPLVYAFDLSLMVLYFREDILRPEQRLSMSRRIGFSAIYVSQRRLL